MNVINELEKIFEINKINEYTYIIKKNDFEITLMINEKKYVTPFFETKKENVLINKLVNLYHKYVEKTIVKSISEICNDCEIKVINNKIKISYKDSYLIIFKNNIKSFIKKEHFKKFLEIQEKLNI
jgi:hypothetical protein